MDFEEFLEFRFKDKTENVLLCFSKLQKIY